MLAILLLQNPREITELQTILASKTEQLDLSDVNYLLEMLAQRKQKMEETSIYVQNELLKEFLIQVRKHKQEQLDQITREINLIEDDKRVVELSACSSKNEAAKSQSPGEVSVTSAGAQSNVDSSSLMAEFASSEPSSSAMADQTDTFNRNVNTTQLGAACLTQRRKKMTVHFEDLEQCYFNTRAKSLVLSSTGEETSDDGLREFTETLNRFTVHTALRPLATLTYTSDPFSGSSIVSSIEFDKDNEFFAIAGVTKKIKLFEYATVVRDTLDMHYPINEMECNSKISCVSWSNYYKSMMASSDYEGSVTVWDAFTNQKIKTFQEHEKRCWSVDFNKCDTKLIASGSDDARVKLWSTNMEHSVTSLEAKANVCCVKFNPTSRYNLAFGSADHCVHYYDLRNTKGPLSVFKGHKKAVSYVKFLNDTEIVSASTDSQLKLWSTHSQRSHCQRSFKGHVNEKNFVGLATDGDYVACGSENNSLYIYYKGLSKHALTFFFDSSKLLVSY